MYGKTQNSGLTEIIPLTGTSSCPGPVSSLILNLLSYPVWAARWQASCFFLPWVPPRFTVVWLFMWWFDTCNILCLLIWQAISSFYWQRWWKCFKTGSKRWLRTAVNLLKTTVIVLKRTNCSNTSIKRFKKMCFPFIQQTINRIEFPLWLSRNESDLYPWGHRFNPWPCSVG